MADSFDAALAKRDDPAEVLDPRTGEVVDFYEAAHPYLVDVLLVLRDYEQKIKGWRQVVEDELVRRHGDRRSAQVVGSHEVDVDRGYSRVWDADELEGVLNDLWERGVELPGHAVEILSRETKVDGRKAQALLNRVDGDTLVELRRCFKWEQRGRAKVRVTPVAELEA